MTRGWCRKHYQRWWIHGDAAVSQVVRYEGAACAVDGCEGPAKSLGWCSKHYLRWRRNGSAEGLGAVEDERRCGVEGCAGGVVARKMCGAHYEAWRARRRTGAATKERPGRRTGGEQTCTAEGCGEQVAVRRLCRKHYQAQAAQRGRVRGPRCAFDGCKLGVYGRGWCIRHSSQKKRRRALVKGRQAHEGHRTVAKGCGVAGCNGKVAAGRRCEVHVGQGECDVARCRAEVHARGLCGRHYYRWRTYGSPEGRGEKRKREGRGEKWERELRSCTVAGCSRRHVAKGLCMPHYQAKRRYGSVAGAGPRPARHGPELRRRKRPAVSRHGSVRRYEQGCRCEVCVPHGSERMYNQEGCRCEECNAKEAERELAVWYQ